MATRTKVPLSFPPDQLKWADDIEKAMATVGVGPPGPPGADGTALADSSETVKGKIEIATQAETNATSDDERAVTPKKIWGRSLPKVTVNRGGTNFTPVAATWTPFTWTTEKVDSHSFFDLATGKFQPTIPGYYVFSGQTIFINVPLTSIRIMAVFKNETNFAAITTTNIEGLGTDWTTQTAGITVGVAGVQVFLNGSTDYVQAVYWTQAVGGSEEVSCPAYSTWFSGYFIGA